MLSSARSGSTKWIHLLSRNGSGHWAHLTIRLYKLSALSICKSVLSSDPKAIKFLDTLSLYELSALFICKPVSSCNLKVNQLLDSSMPPNLCLSLLRTQFSSPEWPIGDIQRWNRFKFFWSAEKWPQLTSHSFFKAPVSMDFFSSVRTQWKAEIAALKLTREREWEWENKGKWLKRGRGE